MSKVIDTTTGVISVAIFGVTGSFTPADASAWGEVMMSLAPLILILFLIWRIHKLDKQNSECRKDWQRSQDQIILMHRAMQASPAIPPLPPEQRFIEGQFNLEELPSTEN